MFLLYIFSGTIFKPIWTTVECGINIFVDTSFWILGRKLLFRIIWRLLAIFKISGCNLAESWMRSSRVVRAFDRQGWWGRPPLTAPFTAFYSFPSWPLAPLCVCKRGSSDGEIYYFILEYPRPASPHSGEWPPHAAHLTHTPSSFFFVFIYCRSSTPAFSATSYAHRE